MPTLPRPDVTVTHASHATPDNPEIETGAMDLVISRDGKAKSYRISGSTGPEIVKDAVEKVIGDGHTAEWLPRPGEERK